MAYTAVKGGADAIAEAEKLIQKPRTAADEAPVELRQIEHQFPAAVDKVMGEGGLYAPELAALAIRQAEGDLFEAAFMLRAYRSTLPRFGYSLPTNGAAMRTIRRISSTFRDIPGGQLLGRTRDYTQRLLNLDELRPSPNGHTGTAPNGDEPKGATDETDVKPGRFPKVADVMRAMGMLNVSAPNGRHHEPDDITRESMRFPVSRSAWLQAMARGESGALVCLAYSGMRGYGGGGHGTIAELRVGELPLSVTHPITGEAVRIGGFRATEVEMTGPEGPSEDTTHAGGYGLSYGLVFGQNERKAISMALLDSSLQTMTTGDGNPPPANDQEMVLYHTDGIESFGFVEHLKLPHFVTFGSGLQLKLEADGAATPSPNGSAEPSAAEAVKGASDDDYAG